MTYLLSDSSILSAELFIRGRETKSHIQQCVPVGSKNVRVESFNEGFGTE